MEAVRERAHVVTHYLVTHKKRVALMVGFVTIMVGVLEFHVVQHIGIALFCERVLAWIAEA